MDYIYSKKHGMLRFYICLQLKANTICTFLIITIKGDIHVYHILNFSIKTKRTMVIKQNVNMINVSLNLSDLSDYIGIPNE